MKCKTIILDWAGTTVDFGSFAPVEAFMSAFSEYGLSPTAEETRAPMGLAKRTHVKMMLDGGRLSKEWITKFGKPHTDEDIDAIYEKFEPALLSVLKNYADPLPNVLDVVSQIRKMGIKIGSTTGYTKQMMDIVAPLAKENGYAPDFLVCPEDVSGRGRPYPYMLWRNLEALGCPHIGEVIKIGDTEADIQEGKAAGCLSVGVIAGSNVLGLSENEYTALDNKRKEELFALSREKYFASGADFVIESIAELPKLIVAVGG
ncbi:MAG: phosphonoacetaldehyde hydrolase [Oscillospiraceae bacterium]|nr:phosphonoacetaldehyde hydrolase [Oscillospiraceae bacterium]MCL2279776.1 phosphonoacetaldehyde hydrolase [Oscillospiraceae bacterium]